MTARDLSSGDLRLDDADGREGGCVLAEHPRLPGDDLPLLLARDARCPTPRPRPIFDARDAVDLVSIVVGGAWLAVGLLVAVAAAHHAAISAFR